MTKTRVTFREGFNVAGSVLLVLLSLPLLALLALVARPVLLAAAVAALVAGVTLRALSPRFREWLAIQEEPEMRYKGLRLAGDVGMHPGHAWARITGDHATVGTDDLVSSVLGPVESVELPARGQKVRQGEPLLVLRRGERQLALRAPLSGRVVQLNEEIESDPRLINDAPFAEGWMVRLALDAPRRERRALRRGAPARVWFRSEVDRLLQTLAPAPSPALADGGVLVHELYRQIDAAAWKDLQAAFFSDQPAAGKPA